MGYTHRVQFILAILTLSSFALGNDALDALHNPNEGATRGATGTAAANNPNNLPQGFSSIDFSQPQTPASFAAAAGMSNIASQMQQISGPNGQNQSGNQSSSGGRGAGGAEASIEAGKSARESIDSSSEESNKSIQGATDEFVGSTLPGLQVDEGPVTEAVGAVAQASAAAAASSGGQVGGAIVDSIVGAISQLAQTRVNIIRTLATQFTPPPQAAAPNAGSSAGSRTDRVAQASVGSAGAGPLSSAATVPTVSSAGFGFRRSEDRAFRGVDSATVYNFPEGVDIPQGP